MIVTMKGKERDIELAIQLKEGFINRYKHNERELQNLIETLGAQTLDRLIHRLKIEKNINLYRDYAILREIALEVKQNSTRQVFEMMSKVDDARVWINDNVKYGDIAFEVLYNIFKDNPKIEPLVEEVALQEAK